MTFEWRQTNGREQHCRVDGRIVGKIHIQPSANSYECYINNRQLMYVGSRRDAEEAKRLVERAASRYVKFLAVQSVGAT